MSQPQKERKTQSLQKKYDVHIDYEKLVDELCGNKVAPTHREWEELPHFGIFYVPEEHISGGYQSMALRDYNGMSAVKHKVYKVDDKAVYTTFWDDHHNAIVNKNFYFRDNWVLQGNILKPSARVKITEEKQEDTNMLLKDQVLLVFDVVNKNGRLYNREEFDKHILLGLQHRAEAGTLFGELGYPAAFNVSLKNVSHQISNVRIEGNKLLGDVKILSSVENLEAAKTLNLLIRQGIPFVFRPRAVGKTSRYDNYDKIEAEGFFINSFDAIHANEDAFQGLL